MIAPKILNFSSLEEAESSISEVAKNFIDHGLVVLRGLSLTESDQKRFTKLFGDEVGTYPNSTAGLFQLYTENHSRVALDNKSKDEILVPWHIEHVENCSPPSTIVGGVWNMYKYSTSAENGNTYFYDTGTLFSLLTPEEQGLFRETLFEWTLPQGDGSMGGPYIVPAVGIHWKTGEEVLRIPINPSRDHTRALDLDGNLHSESKNSTILDLWESCVDRIGEDTSIRVVQQWEQGDLVVVDLYKNAHAVAGGFDPADREFTGLWLYAVDNETDVS